MKLSNVLVGSVLLSASVVSQSFAADFGSADALYERRAEGTSVISEAQAAYKAQLGSSNNDEKLYATAQIGRLAYYAGLITPESEKQARISIFQGCLDAVEGNITPDAIGETPDFYFWKGVCLASWAKAKGISSSLARSGELVETIEKGISIDPSYEGGGFHRLGSAVFQNLPPVNPFGPTKDLDRSLEYAELAISSDAYASEKLPETATGDYFFNVFEYQAGALAATGNRDEAVAVLEEAIERIEGGDVPEDRLPETDAFLVDLKEALNAL